LKSVNSRAEAGTSHNNARSSQVA